MSIKTEAAIKTVFFMGTMFLGAYAMSALLTYLDPSAEDVVKAVIAVCVVVWAYIIYSYQVSQAEYRVKLAEITNKE